MLVSSPLTAGRLGATWTSKLTSGHRRALLLDDRGHEVLEQRRLLAELEALVESREHEQVLDQPVEAVGLAGDVGQDLAGHRGIEGLARLREHRGAAVDRGDGRPQLV